MDSGYYAAMTGLVARTQALDTAASNLANAQASSGTSVENATPSWMTPQEPAPEKDELTDWLSRADQVSASSSTPLPASDQPAGSAAWMRKKGKNIRPKAA